MGRSSSQHPTELELAILKVLWQSAPRTVEGVREALAAADRDLTHSSVITVMNIMVRKRYLNRTKKGRAFEYEPLLRGRDVNRRFLHDLVNRVFDGSAKAVMLELLETSDVDADELAEIRRLIDRGARGRRR
ncbi:MAG TPA: BlaI/MecI/CopY family transcriptional regulator [Isosphaeraceae bacterium]|nr:BlaI/MecI/CopY family transcriptional regulator [Isosphaeraceae bacterium]